MLCWFVYFPHMVTCFLFLCVKVSAALFSGNAIVIKVSEFASFSIDYYKRIIDACLEAVGAPKDLVQFVVGYGLTGDALVRSGVDKIIFVGSPAVGAMVAKAAAGNGVMVSLFCFLNLFVWLTN